jgi:hypothetical protein
MSLYNLVYPSQSYRCLHSPSLKRGYVRLKATLLVCLFLKIVIILGGCQTFGNSDRAVKQVTKKFRDIEEFKNWFVFYYQNPKPDELTSALHYMEQMGLLLEYPEVASMFVSQVFKSHSESVPLWVNSWDKDFSERQWTVVVVALWMTDRNDLKTIALKELRRFEKKKSEQMGIMLNKTSAKALDPLHSEIINVGQLNMLWAAFSATGNPQYISRVVGLISGFAGSPKVSRKNIGEAALVSLAQNTLIHPVVEEYVKEAETSHPDPTTRALIQAMLQALDQLSSQGEILPQLPRR